MTTFKFTDAHYIALGKMLVAFQSLDMTVTHQLAFLMYPHPDDHSMALTGFHSNVLMELPFKKRINLIMNLIKNLPDGDTPKECHRSQELNLLVKELIKALNQAGKAEESRNKLVHSNWIGEGMCGIEGAPSDTIMRYKHNLRSIDHELMTAENILAVVNQIETSEKSIRNNAQNIVLHIKYTRTAIAKIAH